MFIWSERWQSWYTEFIPDFSSSIKHKKNMSLWRIYVDKNLDGKSFCAA